MQLTFQFDSRREPPDEAARRRIREDTASTLLVEAGAGAGKTSAHRVDRRDHVHREGGG
jgi:hypothetical protein